MKGSSLGILTGIILGIFLLVGLLYFFKIDLVGGILSFFKGLFGV